MVAARDGLRCFGLGFRSVTFMCECDCVSVCVSVAILAPAPETLVGDAKLYAKLEPIRASSDGPHRRGQEVVSSTLFAPKRRGWQRATRLLFAPQRCSTGRWSEVFTVVVADFGAHLADFDAHSGSKVVAVGQKSVTSTNNTCTVDRGNQRTHTYTHLWHTKHSDNPQTETTRTPQQHGCDLAVGRVVSSHNAVPPHAVHHERSVKDTRGQTSNELEPKWLEPKWLRHTHTHIPRDPPPRGHVCRKFEPASS